MKPLPIDDVINVQFSDKFRGNSIGWVIARRGPICLFSQRNAVTLETKVLVRMLLGKYRHLEV
jgi:hypothetical protein